MLPEIDDPNYFPCDQRQYHHIIVDLMKFTMSALMEVVADGSVGSKVRFVLTCSKASVSQDVAVPHH